MAFVTADSATPQQIWQQLIGSGLPKIWIPKADDIRFIEKLPMLGTGKVDLRAVKQMALAV